MRTIKTCAMNHRRCLHLYFPENDIALARDLYNFTPPMPALQMRLCGQSLPMWYGEDGDAFIDYGIDCHWYAATSEAFGLRVDTMPKCLDGYMPKPWGWSRASRKVFLDSGVRAEALPDDEALTRIRMLSSRRTAALLGRAMAESLPFAITAPPQVFTDTNTLAEYISHMPRGCIVKMPWSNAGRGNIDSTATPLAELIRRCSDAIKRYGMVCIEPRHDRVADFAMLWTAQDDGTVAYNGLSLFETTDTGAYTANIVLSDSDIRAILQQYIPAWQIDTVIRTMRPALERIIAGTYHGPLGVDMLVARTDAGYILDAVVEVNMRRTMGHVAHTLAARHLADGSIGRMYVNIADKETANDAGCNPMNGCDIDVSGRLRHGRVNLTPPTGRFRYIFEATSERVPSKALNT